MSGAPRDLDDAPDAPDAAKGELALTVNGEPMTLPVGAASGLTIAGLIERLGLGGGPVAVERNGDVVPRAEHAATRLECGDVLEIVHFVGGG